MDATPRIQEPLYWERLGRTGPPVAMLHPNPTDHGVWIYQMARFSTWFRTIAIDLPGYGRSPAAQAGLTMTDVAEACWEAVDATSSEPAILFGCSVGYAAALHMAHLRPNRVRALILSGCSYRPVKQSAPRRIAQYSEHGLESRRSHMGEVVGAEFRSSPLLSYFTDMFLERNGTADLETILELWRAVGAPDPDWLFSEIRCPTLIITGSEDGAHQGAFALQERIPGAELRTIVGAGHACMLEKPWEWDELALRFLRERGLMPE